MINNRVGPVGPTPSTSWKKKVLNTCNINLNLKILIFLKSLLFIYFYNGPQSCSNSIFQLVKMLKLN